MEAQKKLSPAVAQLIARLETMQSPQPEAVVDVVKQSDICPEDLMEFADFDHPPADGYGRKLLYAGPHFEVMVMSWNPGDFSVVHNHGHTQWGAVQVFGFAQHNIFHDKAHHLSFARREILQFGQVVKVTHQLIHQMGNPTSERFLSLHIYGCNQELACVTADARHYEVEKQRTVHTTGGAFLDLPEAEVYQPKANLSCDDDVFLYQAGLLMRQYFRKKAKTEVKARLLKQLDQRLRVQKVQV